MSDSCETKSTLFLSDSLALARAVGRRLTVSARVPAPYDSSSVIELIDCRCDDGREVRIFCKRGTAHGGFDNHRYGVEYEAYVYRHLLSRFEVSVPTFLGSLTDKESGECWLALEHLQDGLLVSGVPDVAGAMRQAARWIGEFHARTLASMPEGLRLRRYEKEFYVGWARRTREFSRELLARYPWITAVCDRSERAFEALLFEPVPVIHGEFEADNILMSGDTIYPVDWESAAIAAGEIDLATLTWGWSADIATACELEYAHSRWACGAPTEFWHRLAVARIYLPLRWLGYCRKWTMEESSSLRFSELLDAATELGIV